MAATVLSIYYSWKKIPESRRKEIPGIDMAINAVGCGIGSILIGYSFAAPAILDWQPLLVGIGFSIALFGGLPTTQIFQHEQG